MRTENRIFHSTQTNKQTNPKNDTDTTVKRAKLTFFLNSMFFFKCSKYASVEKESIHFQCSSARNNMYQHETGKSTDTSTT